VRVLHISDLHVEPEPERRLPGLMATLERDREQLLACGADLALVTGDLTTFGYEELDHLKLARTWLDRLDIPYLAVPGNHDLSPRPDMERYEDVPYAETNYGRVFDANPIVQRDLGPVRVIGAGLREDDPDDVLPRLEDLISADPRPVVLGTHYPVVPTRPTRIHEFFGSEAFAPRTTAALLELIRRNDNIVLYACGHVHVSSTRRVAPHCLQITAGSLGQGPSCYRIFDIEDGGLTYATVLGSGPLGFWERSVEGLDRDFSLGDTDERSGRWTW
jgi:Icc protein